MSQPSQPKDTPAGFTPGPWQIRDRGNDGVFVIVDDLEVVRVYRLGLRGRAEQQANARLIAAAPDLFEACRNLLRAIEGDFPTDEARDRLTAAYCDSAETAIAKATGRQP